jgi:hypothetical protein
MAPVIHRVAFMRLSHDMNILPRRHYAALSEMTDSLAKQARRDGYTCDLRNRAQIHMIR